MLNLALRKPALQSSVSPYSIGHTPADDAKGGNNGHVSCRFGFHTGAEWDPWWQVDLGDIFVVRQVVIYNRPDYAERLRRFTVLGSNDGGSWEELFRKTDDEVFGRDPFTAEIAGAPKTRFVRVRLDGQAPLHFRECQVFGEHPDPAICARMEREEAKAEQQRSFKHRRRRGRVIEIGGFSVFVDDQHYDRSITAALERGDYEGMERLLVSHLVTQVDRVIDVGTAIGVVAMTAARITGAGKVLTFEANPDIAKDARANFRRNGLGGIRSRVGILRNRQAMTEPHETITFYIDKVFLASRLNSSVFNGNIVKQVQTPIFCLEDAIDEHRATVLICDIEGGEVELLSRADLSAIRLIILETHYWAAGEVATDEMVRQLIMKGFSLHLGMSHTHVLALRRH